MNILITGMNKQQCTENFYLGSQLKIIPSHISLIACLRDMGHTVTQRHVEVGESLDEYDKVITYIHNPSGFAGYIYNALWAIHQANEKVIFAFDDWQTESIYKGLMSLQDTSKLFRKYVKDGHKHAPEDVEKYENEFLNALSIINDRKQPMLISAFSGGDLSPLVDYPEELMYSYNPNPYHINRQPVTNILMPEPKQRVFNFAGLMQDKTKKWLKAQGVENTGWELKQYGSRKDGQDRVTEDEMVTIYSQQWGILMPGYFHAGSGWWRARPLQVADAGSILIGDPDEMMLYYKDEELSSIKAIDLVDMSDKDLEELATAQSCALYENHPLDKMVQQAELEKVLK